MVLNSWKAIVKRLLRVMNLGKPRVHVLGDSHCQVFEYIKENRSIYSLDYGINCCIVQGATNLGLANPHSKTQAMPIFQKYLSNIKRKDFVILMLGEVDCGFVIWYRAQKYNMTIESQFDTSLNNYLTLIEEVLRVGSKKVMICSTPLPTIPDNQLVAQGEVANKRLEVKASLQERTALTRRYNQKLKAMCLQKCVEFIDYEKDIVDLESQTVNSKFLNENPLDHHLSNKSFADVLFPKIKANIENWW